MNHLAVPVPLMPAVQPLVRYVYLDWMRGLAILDFAVYRRHHGRDVPVRLGHHGGFADREPRGPRVGPSKAHVRRAEARGLFLEWAERWRWSNFGYMLQVGILNCIALAIAVSSLIALLPRARRPGAAIALGAAIAALSPVAHALSWSGVPSLVRDYFVPNPTLFSFFPVAAYVPFGIVAGIVIRRAGERHIDNAIRWMAIAGCGLVAGGGFFSSQPYTLYPKVDYWVNSPGLIVVRTGLIVLVLVAAYVWERAGFSTVLVRQLGTTALLVFWAHLELVYGSWSDSLKGRLTAGQSGWATVTIVAYLL